VARGVAKGPRARDPKDIENEVSPMKTSPRTAALLFLLGAACATAGGGGSVSSRFKQADHRIPDLKGLSAQIDEEGLRGKIEDAANHLSRGQQAHESGNMDQARAEFGTAAEIYRSAVETYRSSEWRMPFAYRTAQLFLFAARPEDAAGMALRVVADNEANEVSKAMGAHLAAAAWQQVAVVQVKAGQLEPIRLPTAEQRAGKPLAPTTPPGAWKRFVEAADLYVQFAASDPDQKKPAAERAIPSSPAQLALIAAEVQYAFDNMEEARKRFEAILARWPTEEGIAQDAVPLLLQTHLVQKDEAGYRTALASLRKTYEEAAAAAEKARDEQGKTVATRVFALLSRYEAQASFEQGSALLAQGKAAEAAGRFEAIAAQYPDSPDAPLALYNASIAWTKAEQAEKAAAAAGAILEKYPDSKVAPGAMLSLAAVASRKGDHRGAAARYADFLQKYPDAPNRCLALQNLGYENDVQGNRAEAAARYLAFGSEPACAKEDPSAAARALYRAGKLFQDAKQPARSLEAFTAASKVQGVTDEVAKSQVEDAKRIVRRKR
jgi:TolA-binding protein